GGGPLTLTGNGAPVSLISQAVNGDFFPTLGIRPVAGRLLGPADEQPNAAPALVLSYAYWQREFGGSRDAVGKVVTLNGVPFTIAGVAEQKFNSLAVGGLYDIWYPMAMMPRTNARFFARRQNDVSNWWLLMAGRMKPDVPRQLAQAQI